MSDPSPPRVTADRALADFSRLLLEIYRLADHTPAEHFQEAALAAAASVLGFDSALWGSGVATASGPIVHAIHLQHQPPEMMASWERIKHLDKLNAVAIQNVGRTIAASADRIDAGTPFDPLAAAHCHRFGLEQLLTTVFVDPASGLFSAISLYRADPAAPFSETERAFKEQLTPHLAEAWTDCRLNMLRLQPAPQAGTGRPLGLCDRAAVLHLASAEFIELLRTEWPQHQGPLLPAELLKAPGSIYVGQQVVMSLAPFNDLWLISGRRKHTLDHITSRELEVARRYGQGESHREIAAALGISPATARNHLKNVYGKLGVGNKVELVRLLG